jgi:hypothetical protein
MQGIVNAGLSLHFYGQRCKKLESQPWRCDQVQVFGSAEKRKHIFHRGSDVYFPPQLIDLQNIQHSPETESIPLPYLLYRKMLCSFSHSSFM